MLNGITSLPYISPDERYYPEKIVDGEFEPLENLLSQNNLSNRFENKDLLDGRIAGIQYSVY